jgi:hypothetical protein
MRALALCLILSAAPSNSGESRTRITLGGKVGRGESRTFTARGLVPGRSYVFLATGTCWQILHGGGQGRSVKRSYADASVVGFSAQIADGPERALVAGPNSIEFVAPSRNVMIKVFDRIIPGSLRCVFDWFAVESS